MTNISVDKHFDVDYRLIDNKENLLPFVDLLMSEKIIGLDIETTGLDPHQNKIRLIQLALPNKPVLVIDCFTFLEDGYELLKSILEQKNIKIIQNAKFELQFFMAIDIHIPKVFDTMIVAQLLRFSTGQIRYGLDSLSQYFLNVELDKTEQKSDWSATLTERQIVYSAMDAIILHRLREKMIPLILEHKLEKIVKIELDCVIAIAQIEFNGIYLDLNQWKKLTEETKKVYHEKLLTIQKYIPSKARYYNLFGEEIVEEYNLDSAHDLRKLLKENGINLQYTARHNLSAFADHPLVAEILEYRKHSKSLSTFLEPLVYMIHPKTKRLHPKYMQNGAWSGRMSCHGPNIQQIPRGDAFRACFTAPRDKKLIVADYSQIELRVAASIANDKTMIEAYQKGTDLHTLTASLVSDIDISKVTKEQRQAAKAVNFGLIFGMGARGLKLYSKQSYNVDMTQEQAEKFRERFFMAYTGIQKWHKKIKKEQPTEECTMTGRKFKFSKNAGVTNLYNAPVQGTSADITKYALGLLAQKAKEADFKIIAVVHDEIILEVDESKAEETAKLLKAIMEFSGLEILKNIPCLVEANITDSWSGK
ncbi:MAG: bifunctional 3'-5' exonuclease/DNA polymerase [Erysipelotrichales bacterium]|nr:bifunctional 3'-5' exonuclease/DNA polymerase [Erysipelotrichales bacterium]